MAAYKINLKRELTLKIEQRKIIQSYWWNLFNVILKS